MRKTEKESGWNFTSTAEAAVRASDHHDRAPQLPKEPTDGLRAGRLLRARPSSLVEQGLLVRRGLLLLLLLLLLALHPPQIPLHLHQVLAPERVPEHLRRPYTHLGYGTLRIDQAWTGQSWNLVTERRGEEGDCWKTQMGEDLSSAQLTDSPELPEKRNKIVKHRLRDI